MPSPSKVAHEIANLLAIAVGQVEYLLHGGPIDENDRRESLEATRRALLRARDSLKGLSAPAQPVPAGSPSVAKTTARILVIEDDSEVRAALMLMLQSAGHDVIGVDNGAEGVQRYRKERFDGVLTDLGMKGISGLTVSRAIKDADPTAFVVLLSGTGEPPGEAALRAAGVDRVLPKPVTRREILELFASR